jgi:hypothetical protein
MILIQQGVDRIWRLYGLVLRFVPFYERRQDLQPVSIGSPGFRVHEPFDFLKRGPMVCSHLDWTNLHRAASHA